MYKNKFILAIRHNNKILRETKNIVQLPFDSEYSLLLKNENNRRALIKIKIDSEDVLFGSELVLDANSEMNLERFLQNNEYGNKFKFVKLSNNNIKDKENPENGLIEADFWLEKDFEFFKIIKEKEFVPYPVYLNWPWFKPYEFHRYDWYSDNSDFTKQFITCNAFFSSKNIQTEDISKLNSQENLGATIEGSKSEQKFQNIYTREKDLSTHTQIRLYLRATENPLYVEDTKNKFCSQCGKKLQYKDKFCSQCGNNVEN